jgi:hypothetical protein
MERGERVMGAYFLKLLEGIKTKRDGLDAKVDFYSELTLDQLIL